MADNINIKAILDTSGVDTSLRGLKKELSDLEGLLGSNLIGEKDKRAVLKRVGEVRAGINQMESDIRGVGLAAGSAFGEMLQYTTPVVAGLTAAGAAAQLFGVENEKLNKILQETTRITIALSAFQQIAENNTIKALVTRRTEQLKNLVVSKLTFKQTVQQSVANQAEATTKGLTTIATKLATKAQLTWNAAIAANPIGAIIVAVALLAAGIYALTKILGNNTKELEKQKVALDGTTFATIEARDKYNDLQFTLKELDLEYKSIVGSLSAFERELANLDLEIEKQITKIQNEYIDALEELEKKHNGVWRRMGNFIIETLDNTGILALQRIKKQSDEQISLYEESQNKQTDVLTVGERKRLNIIAKNKRDENKQRRDLLDTQLKDVQNNVNKIISEIEREFNTIRTNLEKIKSNYTTFYENLSDLDLNLMDDGLDKNLKIIDKDINNISNNFSKIINENKQLLEINKELFNLNNSKIDAAEIELLRTKEIRDNNSKIILDLETRLDLLRSAGSSTEEIKSAEVDVNRAFEQQRNIQLQIFDLENEILLTKREQLKINNEIKTGEDVVEKLNKEEEYLNKLNQLRDKKTNEAIQSDKDAQDEKRRQEEQDEIDHQDRLLQIRIELANLSAEKLQKINKQSILDGGETALREIKKQEQEKLKEQIKALENYYQFRIELAKINDPEFAELLQEELDKSMSDLQETFKERWDFIKQDTINIMADIAAIGTDAFMEIFNRSIENKFDQLNERLMNKVSQQKDTLDKLKENDLIDEEEYNARLLKIEEESLKESNRLKYEQAKAEKAAALIQIAIDTAIGAAKAFAQGGGLFGPGLAGLVLFQGAMSAALVASQPLPQYEMGGLVKGLPHSQGGVPVELEGNEYVIRKEIVQQPGVLPLLETINQTPSSKRPQFNNDDNFITELKETILGITQIPVTNLESEYTRVQRRVNSIETRSRF